MLSLVHFCLPSSWNFKTSARTTGELIKYRRRASSGCVRERESGSWGVSGSERENCSVLVQEKK